ncbi:MAG: HAMP domain-containing histidine kinase, partial [Acidimicrobiales bacterium]|nr:HAMP domain-containing histidine kinase [Acidimicrobiales bacterium]
ELVPMDEVSESLNRLRRALTIATLATMAAGVAAGWWVSGRILRPVRRTAEAANLISQGALDRRLESDGDADLDPLVQSFNQMVDGLQLRIEREARFASDVSHELRTPLAAMLAALSIARRRVTEPAGIEALSMLQGEVDRFSDLITDLLEISRVEAGVAELNVEEVSPRRLMTGVLESLDHQDIPVTIDSNTPAMVSLDSRRITQVLTNLIQNADHYAGGATHIYLSGSEEMLEIVIDDDGPGIALEDRVHLFERFIRGKDVSVAGTGLGLALVKEHVRLHGGSVEVDDAPGGGARFLIHLPREPKK